MDNAVSGVKFSSFGGIKVDSFNTKKVGTVVAYNMQEYDDIIDYNSIGTYEDVYTVESTSPEWYETALDGVLTYYASVANTTIGFVKGVLEFGEDIVDAALWLGTMSTTWPFLLYDLKEGIFEGDWDFSSTGAHFNRTATVVRVKAVDTAFDYLYEETPLKYVEEQAGEAFKRDGVVYSISESAGKYAAAMAVSTVIPGGPVLAKGLTFGVSKFGDEIEKGVIKVTTNKDGSRRDADVLEFAKETLIAGAKGTVEGVVMAGATKISESGKLVQSNLKNAGFNDKVLKVIANEHKAYEIAVKSTKPLANELIGVANGEEFNVKEVLVDTAAVVASEVVATQLSKINPKVEFKTDASAPTTTEASKNALQGAANLNSGSSEFIKTMKKAVSTGINKGIEKAEKEGVKSGVEGISNLTGFTG